MDTLKRMNDELNERNQRYYEVADHASTTVSNYQTIEKKLDKVSQNLEVMTEKYMGSEKNYQRIYADHKKLKEDWDMLNKQASELKNIISRSDNENQSIKSNYIKVIEDREQQLKELILDRSRLKDQ